MKRSHPWAAAGVAALLPALGGCDQNTDVQSTPAPASESAPAEPSATSILGAVNENPEFTAFARLLSAADMAGAVEAEGPFTLFVPTNTAFDKLRPEETRALSQPENRERLRALLAGHMVAERIMVTDLDDSDDEAVSLTTLAGSRLTLRHEDGQWRIRDARGGVSTIAMPDVTAANGVIHAVDTVMWPN